MTTFGIELERLTREFIGGVVEVVRRHLAQEEQSKPTAATRPEARSTRAAEPQPTTTVAEIPPPRIERKPPVRRRGTGTGARRRTATPVVVEPTPPPIHFEVVPHPERRNRRLVVTRLDTKSSHGTNGLTPAVNGSAAAAPAEAGQPQQAPARAPETVPPSSERPISGATPEAAPSTAGAAPPASNASPPSSVGVPPRFGDQVLVRWKR